MEEYKSVASLSILETEQSHKRVSEKRGFETCEWSSEREENAVLVSRSDLRNLRAVIVRPRLSKASSFWTFLRRCLSWGWGSVSVSHWEQKKEMELLKCELGRRRRPREERVANAIVYGAQKTPSTL